jgi:hypothetical protein
MSYSLKVQNFNMFQIRFVGVGVDGISPIIEELVSIKYDLGLIDMHGFGPYRVKKQLGLITVLGSFYYKDLSKILAKFGFMMDSYKVELKMDYYIFMLDKDFIYNMETKG